MRTWIGLLGTVVSGLALGVSSAQSLEATTAAALSLREGPGTNYVRLAAMPPGARVEVAGCRSGWCAITWGHRSGYASQKWLIVEGTRADVLEPEIWPILPPYPYRAGHYPKADWYYDMPPYTAISPSFYRKRFFMLAQERNRYRYVPQNFHGISDGYDSGGIQEIDTQGYRALLSAAESDKQVAYSSQSNAKVSDSRQLEQVSNETVTVASTVASPQYTGSIGRESAIARGKSIAETVCTVCHTMSKGGTALYGPNLFGVVGRPVAGVRNYAYSSSLKQHEGVWTPMNLDAWLEDPSGYAPGTTMVFAGIKSDSDRRDLIEYLGSLKTKSAAR